MKKADRDAGGSGCTGRSSCRPLTQAGRFHGAHRSADGVPALASLLATAKRPGWSSRALGAHLDVKDASRGRRHRWNPNDELWSREVGDADRHAEATWLAEHVYAPQHMPRADGPVVPAVTWKTRHGR